MARRVAEWAMALASMTVVAGLVVGLGYATAQVRPAPAQEPGVRYEPPAVPGARVQTSYGPGVLVRPIRYGDGPRWQVRLETGRYVVLYRAQFHVTGGDGACDGDP